RAAERIFVHVAPRNHGRGIAPAVRGPQEPRGLGLPLRGNSVGVHAAEQRHDLPRGAAVPAGVHVTEIATTACDLGRYSACGNRLVGWVCDYARYSRLRSVVEV